MKYFFYNIFLLIWFSGTQISPLFARQQLQQLRQENPDLRFKINAIQIEGNRRTKAFVILEEMQVHPGDTVTLAEVEADRKRIENLELFTRVEIQLLAEAEGVRVLILVTEQWFLWPYPIYFRNEKDWKKWSYGVGIIHRNFRGQRETLDLSGYLGYSKKFNFSYFIPWFVRRWKVYAAFNLYLGRNKSQNLDRTRYSQDQQNIGFGLGKRYGYFTYLDYYVGYLTYTARNVIPIPTLNTGGRDRFWSNQISFRYDTRDLYEFPRRGSLLGLFWRQNGQPGQTVNYARYGIDARHYFGLPANWCLALRSDLGLAHGRIPAYDHLFLGYSERIRGHFFEHYEGENRFIGSLELRFPIRKITYHSFFQDTPLAQYYQNLKFGISGGIFTDLGAVWNQNQAFEAAQMRAGFGVGLFFHLPYVQLVRLEYALDTKWNDQFILFDLGVSF